MRKLLAIVLCCLAVIIAGSISVIKQQAASVKGAGWNMRFRAGQTFDYTLHGSMTGGRSQTTMSTTTTMAETVTAVDADGTATLNSKAVQYLVTVGGDGVEKRSAPVDVSSRLSISARGMMTCPDNTGGQSGMVAPNDGAFLPSFNAKPGDTWDLPSPINGITAHARLTSIQVDSGGHHVGRIETLATGKIGATQKDVSLKSSILFDIDRGILISRQATMLMGSPVELTAIDRQDLVKASN